jgi:hypothetical protein
MCGGCVAFGVGTLAVITLVCAFGAWRSRR